MEKKKFITVNWNAINRVINDPEMRGEMRRQLKEATKKIDDKCNKAWREGENKKEMERVAGLKNLPIGSLVFYKGRDKNLFGLGGDKLKDGVKYMIVLIKTQRWKLPYRDVQIDPVNSEQKNMMVLNNIANRIFNK